jgi:protein CpxP
MIENTNDNPVTQPRASAKRRFASRWLLALPLAGLLVGGAAMAQAHGGGPFGGPGRGEMGEFMAFRMHKLLDSVGATDAQKAQIKAAWQPLRPQLQAVHADGMEIHQQLTAALTAPTIDRAEVERLRKESVQLADRASTLFTQGIVSTAQALTPEQRQKLATEIAQHRHERGR